MYPPKLGTRGVPYIMLTGRAERPRIVQESE